MRSKLGKQQRERHRPNPIEEDIKDNEEGEPLDLLPFQRSCHAPIAVDH
jgi:hypothetical protein